MVKRTLVERVEVLEQRVTKLEELPAEVAALRVEFAQFRAENSADHSAMRQEFRRELREGLAALRQELQVKFDEAKRHSLVLHEHLVDLIQTIRKG